MKNQTLFIEIDCLSNGMIWGVFWVSYVLHVNVCLTLSMISLHSLGEHTWYISCLKLWYYVDEQSTPTHCLWQNPHLTCLFFRQYTCPPTSTLCSKEVCCKLQSLRGFLRFLAERILVRVFPMKRASCFVSSEPQWFKQNVQKMLVRIIDFGFYKE